MDDKAINLFHIKSKRLIEKAPVKSQCARDYFYGEDLILEKGFQSLEGEYASILRRIFDSDSVDDAAGGFLRDFSYLQYLRTEIAIRRGLIAQTEMADLIFESSQDERPPDFTRKEFIQLVMNTFADSVSDISDLKVCILRNERVIVESW